MKDVLKERVREWFAPSNGGLLPDELRQQMEPKACPLCAGEGKRIYCGNRPPEAMCNGKSHCKWYHVMVPFDVWQDLKR